MERVGEYEYSRKDLIGHGAFALVYKGHSVKVKAVICASIDYKLALIQYLFQCI